MLSNFSLKSQWLYLLPLDVNPKRVPDSTPLGRHFALSEDVLPQLITPLEKKLGVCCSYFHFPMRNKIKLTTFVTLIASQVSLRPTINFVIYAVPCDSAPLHIYTRSGHRWKITANVEAFLSPRYRFQHSSTHLFRIFSNIGSSKNIVTLTLVFSVSVSLIVDGVV